MVCMHTDMALCNPKVLNHGRMPLRIRGELHALYDPFVERLYTLVERHAIRVTPCEHMGTRFLDDHEWITNSSVGGAALHAASRRARRQGTPPDDRRTRSRFRI